MKIKSLHLKNFKRFTDVTLENIPENAKLILLIGSNGSVKSSVFDSFELISDIIHHKPNGYPDGIDFSGGKQYSYYHKFPGLLQINLIFFSGTNIQCIFKTIEDADIKFNSSLNSNLFYGRSAVRYLPRITRTSIGQTIDIFKDNEEYKKQKGLFSDKELYKETIKLAKDKVIQELTFKIATIRNSYPFFDDPNFDTKENTNHRRFKNKDENFANTALVVGD